MKKLIRKYFPKYFIKSYSQEGEDIILSRYFDTKSTGFYIDIGAHHPYRFSNTYLFYKRGWHGINIDAMPGSMKIFNIKRPNDINLEYAISNSNQLLTFYIYQEKALNTFSKELVDFRTSINTHYKIDSSIQIQTKKLDFILNKYLKPNQIVDFLTIDVEGLDFEVLQSNNWYKYKPRLILVEIIASNFQEILNHKISIYLKNFGYHIYAKSVNTVIYQHNSELNY